MIKKAWPRQALGITGAVIVLAVLVALGNILFLQASKAQAVAPPPIAFSHKVMVGAGVNCLFCHSGALKSPVAGIPSVQKCMGCHSVIGTTSPEVQKLAGYWQRGETIPWPRVNTLPRFVYFSHEVHVAAGGLNCERCHGNVSQMTLDQPVVQMNMGWCLNCHSQQANASQLIDCVVCHK